MAENSNAHKASSTAEPTAVGLGIIRPYHRKHPIASRERLPMHVYTVREPFAGFAKGAILPAETVATLEAQGDRDLDHHLIRLWIPDPAAPAPEAPL
jgi:hypothetical protein